MGKARSVEEMEVWKSARELCRGIYALAKQGHFARDFGLRDQIQRASVSVMSNIAEGLESDGKKNLARYLCLARASAAEVRTQLCVALDQDYISQNEFEAAFSLSKKITRQLTSFINYLRCK